VTGNAGSGSVILLEGSEGAGASALAIMKAFIVENEGSPEGAFLRTEGSLPGFQLALIHTTIAGSPVILDASVGGPGARFSSARNILLDSPSATVGSGWEVEVTMDQAIPNQQGWLAQFDGVSGIVGPAPPPLPDDLFGDGAAFSALPEPSRVLALCPDLEDTDNLGPNGGEGFCALDRAAFYLPSPAAIEVGSVFWPWENSFLPSLPHGSPENMPGASGWSCDPWMGPLDQFDFGNGLEGDGDGWTTLVDCDPDVPPPPNVPNLPELNGYDTEECEEIANDCYSCPPDLGDDDDDAIDDDDAVDDDDSTPTDDDDSGSGDTDISGCAETGCGVPYRCEDGRPVAACFPLVVALGLVRRRRALGDPQRSLHHTRNSSRSITPFLSVSSAVIAASSSA
jgi:hypothetical protein